MTKDYLELQSIIQDDNIITNVEHRNNRVYFKIDGRQFCTMGNWVYHEDHPLYNHVISDIMAERHNTPEGIEQDRISSEESSKKIDLWFKHKRSLYKLVFLAAFEILLDKGEKEFEAYIDHYFQIMEEGNNCDTLFNLLENTKDNEDRSTNSG